jgi:hypothetical protein
MSAPLNPSVRFTLLLEKVPASSGTQIIRTSIKPLADAGAWAEGRSTKMPTIERSLSTADGDYDIATVDAEFDDSDGFFRGLLSSAATRTFTSREAAVELLSEAGRWAGTAWRSLFRGRVTDIQATLGRKARIRMADEVGSHFSGFDLEKTIPQVTISRREHPSCPDENVGRPYPIILGEFSDVGVTDANGNAADKGMLPVVDVGDYLLTDDGSDVPEDAAPAYLIPPANLVAVNDGASGTTTRVYGVTAVSPYGETTQTIITVTDGPDTLNGTDSTTLGWDTVEGAIEYRVYGRNTETPIARLARLNNGETYTDPETTWTDDGSASETAYGPPAVNSALVDQVLDSGAAAFAWGRLIVKLGAAAEIHHVYASDLADGTAPKRVRMDESVYGSEFLVYGRAGWPHDDPFIEIGGIRMGVIYARGPRLDHHRRHIVTIAVNGCGDEDTGDGTGDTITDAFPALQHLLNEYVLKDSGVGYLTGDFGPLEEYSNGVAKLKTSAFAACQTKSATWIGGTGYQAAIAIHEPTSLRDILRRFNVTFACHVGTNHHGQMYPVLIDDTASSTTGRHYRDRVDGISLVSQNIDHDAVETKVVYHYDFDPDANRFRITDQVIEDEAASEAHKGVRQRSARQCYYTRDEATAVDANSRHLTRYKVAPRYLAFRSDLTGLEDENGAQVRVTHYDGAGSAAGDVATPMLVMKHKVDPNHPMSTVLTCLDLGRILSTGLPLLGSTAVISGNLGDETSVSTPPTGAYELR